MNSNSVLYEGDSSIHVMPSATHSDGDIITAELQAWTRRIDAVWNAYHFIAGRFDHRAATTHHRRSERKLIRTSGFANLKHRHS